MRAHTVPFGAVIAAAGLLLIAGPLIAGLCGVMINTSASLPTGYYQSRPLVLERGALVVACVPAEAVEDGTARRYISPPPIRALFTLPGLRCPEDVTPILKPIGAVPGDLVELQADRVTVNGIALPNSGTHPEDSLGRPLTHWPWGTYRVADNEVWLFATEAVRSWDSRYFGPVPLDRLLSGARPLWVWE